MFKNIDDTGLNWIRHWAVGVEASATQKSDDPFYKGQALLMGRLIEMIDRRLEKVVNQIPVSSTIRYQQREIEALTQKLHEVQDRLNKVECTLDEVDEQRCLLKKENEVLRKDYKKSEWYKTLKKENERLGKRGKEALEACGRLGRRLIQYEKKYGKLEDNE